VTGKVNRSNVLKNPADSTSNGDHWMILHFLDRMG